MSAYGQNNGPFYRPSLFGGFSFFPPVIKALMISNTAVYLLLGVLLRGFVVSGVPVFMIFEDYLSLHPLGANFWPWQLFTYMFLHGGFLHLFFNMLMLWMFGMELENIWGSRKFLLYYILCGLGGGLANLLVAPLIAPGAPTVGASGAVFGVLLAFGMMFPDRTIYLFFLPPVKTKYFIAVYIGLELVFGVIGTSDGVAHFAHLGGAAVGFIFLLVDMNLIPVRRWWEMVRGPHKDATYTTPWSSSKEVRDAKFYDIRTGKPLQDDEEANQAVIDAILDKISKGGYQSLTDDEKKKLFEASKKIH